MVEPGQKWRVIKDTSILKKGDIIYVGKHQVKRTFGPNRLNMFADMTLPYEPRERILAEGTIDQAFLEDIAELIPA